MVRRSVSAAMFHDIGKAQILLTMLDKHGHLDDRGYAVIKTHPAIGFEISNGNAGISSEILDAARHHHEILTEADIQMASVPSITDIVRILTTSDVFAALIEHRTSKPAMPREQAYKILCGMKGKLEKPLVRAFQVCCAGSLKASEQDHIRNMISYV